MFLLILQCVFCVTQLHELSSSAADCAPYPMCTTELRDMAKKADAQKAEEKSAAATMNSIEEAARKQFEKDQEAAAAIAGKWVWDEASVYYYNELHRCAATAGSRICSCVLH